MPLGILGSPGPFAIANPSQVASQRRENSSTAFRDHRRRRKPSRPRAGFILLAVGVAKHRVYTTVYNSVVLT
jgi:hypothetical protein